MGGKHCLVRIFNAEDKSERTHEKKKKKHLIGVTQYFTLNPHSRSKYLSQPFPFLKTVLY